MPSNIYGQQLKTARQENPQFQKAVMSKQEKQLKYSWKCCHRGWEGARDKHPPENFPSPYNMWSFALLLAWAYAAFQLQKIAHIVSVKLSFE